MCRADELQDLRGDLVRERATAIDDGAIEREVGDVAAVGEQHGDGLGRTGGRGKVPAGPQPGRHAGCGLRASGEAPFAMLP